MTTPDQEALEWLRRQAEATPNDPDVLVALAAAIGRSGGAAEAREALYRRVLGLRPCEPQALRALGDLYQLQGRYDEALAIADAAIAAQPDAADGWLIRGDALGNAGRAEEAAAAYRTAARSDDAKFGAQVRLGRMLARLDAPQDAMAAFDAALVLRPDAPEPLYERGRAKLERGDFATGWADYEARWRMESFLARSRGQVPLQLAPALATAPTLDDLRGRSVLLVGEQGIGDQVMFASMLPDLQAAAARVVCICEPRLLALFAGSFPGVTFMHPSGARIEDVDVLVAMGSLGSAFRRSTADFPGGAYLRASDAGRARWRAWLGPRTRPLRLGLSWRGGAPTTDRKSRSIPLDALAPLLGRSDCEFVSVQYGDVEAEVAAANHGRETPIRHAPGAELHDFQDFADLLAELDGLVSVQNAAVHLAGALGKPVLAMIPSVPEWRYMREGQTLPWYGSVRLFRQAAPGDWTGVLRDVGAALDRLRDAS